MRLMKNLASWEDLADAYDKHNKEVQKARTLPMEQLYDWAEKQTDLFEITNDGFLIKKGI